MRKFKRKKTSVYLGAIIFISSFFLPFCNQKKAFSSNDNKEERYNVVFIIVDALRADHLSCYGYNRNTTPFIDSLAKDAVLFTNAISQGTVTWVSVPSIFTSLYPIVHKVLWLDEYLEDAFNTLPDVLKKEGYSTAAFVGPQFETFSGFLNRFDSHILIKDRKHVKSAFVSRILTKKAIDWLRQEHTQPFFLYIHYLDVHAPYVNDEPFGSLFWKEEVTPEMKSFIGSFFRSRNNDPFDSRRDSGMKIMEYLISQYDGKVSSVDNQVKKVLEELRKTGLFNNTIVIITSDHGEEFGEHRNELIGRKVFFHGVSLYESTIRVPLIIKVPRATFKKQVITDLVRQIDIMPTILDILNIRNNSVMQGVSFLPVLEGKEIADLSAFSETPPNRFSANPDYSISLRTKDWKLIEQYRSEDKISFYRLFDLRNDPKEIHDVSTSHPLLVKELKARIRGYSEYSKLREQILGHTGKNRKVILDEAKKERLKSLGYLQ